MQNLDPLGYSVRNILFTYYLHLRKTIFLDV